MWAWSWPKEKAESKPYFLHKGNMLINENILPVKNIKHLVRIWDWEVSLLPSREKTYFIFFKFQIAIYDINKMMPG